MKLAFITPRYAPGGVVGGAETLIRWLARLCAEHQHDVHLLTTCATDHFSWRNDRPPGVESAEGMTVHYFEVNPDRDVETFLRIQNKIDKRQNVPRDEQEQWAANSVCSRSLSQWLASHANEFDAILAGPYLFGITLQAAAIAPEKTWLIPCLHDEPYARLDIVADMFRRVRGCLFNAEPEKEFAETLYGLAPSPTHRVIGMGLDAFEADPNAFAARHGIRDPYVLYCGRREAGKNTPLLLDYLDAYLQRRERPLHLVLTGGGDYDAPERLRPRILDFGFVSEQEKREAMAGAQVFIHPSTNESFGIVLLEAWLAGVPALVHARSAVLSWQCRQANAGLWFSYYPEFEAMLDLLLDTPTLRQTLGQNGRRFVESTYSRGAIAQRLFSLLTP